jgi:predicted SAM-dependent methyltransferase
MLRRTVIKSGEPRLEGFLMKLEIGAGHRPSPGYIHNDVNAFEGIEHVGNPWEIDLPSDSLEEVLALGLVEHLTYDQVDKCFSNVNRMLKSGGVFVFDVPDIPVWCQYVVDHFAGKEIPFTIEHVFATLYGWHRWPGDEHKSGWYQDLLDTTLDRAGFHQRKFGVELFLARGLDRNRFHRPADAHIYCVATKD